MIFYGLTYCLLNMFYHTRTVFFLVFWLGFYLYYYSNIFSLRLANALYYSPFVLFSVVIFPRGWKNNILFSFKIFLPYVFLYTVYDILASFVYYLLSILVSSYPLFVCSMLVSIPLLFLLPVSLIVQCFRIGILQ